MGPEQTETLIAKGRTLMLEEFKYAPESYERALSLSSTIVKRGDGVKIG